jgi:hypothetical protein
MYNINEYNEGFIEGLKTSIRQFDLILYQNSGRLSRVEMEEYIQKSIDNLKLIIQNLSNKS